MHDVTARPLDEAQRVLETVFGRLLDTAYATTHLGFVFTTDDQLYVEQLIVEEFNAEAGKAGWDVRLEQFGPALPDILYRWDGQFFRPAPVGSGYLKERWRREGLFQLRDRTLRLHHEYAKVNGELVPAKQGPIISKPNDGIGWALEYRPVGGLRFVIGDVGTIKLKRGEWLSDTFALLWLIGELETTRSNRFRHHVSQHWDRVLRKRVFWQRFDQVFSWSTNEAEQAEIKLREYEESADQPIYRKPYRKHFWNVKDYSEYGPLGRRQHGGPVRYIAITSARAAFYLWLWLRLSPPRQQRWLEAWRRYYKIDCWLGDHSFDARPSAYLQFSGEPDNPYGRFDQRPCAYLYPEYAPSPDRFGGQVICLPPRDHTQLAASQEIYNERWLPYMNTAAISKRMRCQCSLNIELAVRNNMVENIQNDFGHRPDQEQVA